MSNHRRRRTRLQSCSDEELARLAKLITVDKDDARSEERVLLSLRYLSGAEPNLPKEEESNG